MERSKGMYRTGLVTLLLLCTSAFVKAQAPTVHAKSVTSTKVYCNQLTLSWTNGNGAGRIVLCKEGSKVDTVPLTDNFYPGDLNFGDGEELGTNNFALYSGSGSSIDITGLKKNTTYHFAIFEYNISSPDVDYLTVTGYAEHSVTTEDINSSFTIDNSYQCLANNKINLNATSTNSMGSSMTYKYDFGDKNSATGKTQTWTYATGGFFRIKLTTESLGCKDEVTMVDTVVIPYVTTFALDKSIPDNDSIQCFIGNHFEFKNHSYRPKSVVYGGYDITVFKWHVDGVLDGNGQNHTKIFSAPGVYRIKLVQGRRLKPTPFLCKDSFEATYVVLPEPLQAGDVAFKDTLLCLGSDDFEFEHTSTSATSQRWWFGDGDSSDANPSMHTYGQVGKFEVSLRVQDDSGCVSFYQDSVEVISIPNNDYSGLAPFYCKGDPLTVLKPNIPGGTFEGNNTRSLDSTFTPADTGTYEVHYILQVGNCRDTVKKSVTVLDVPAFSLGNDTLICEGSNFVINPQVTGFTLKWDDGSTNTTRSVNSAGIIWLEASDVQCKFRDSIRVTTMRAPSFEFGQDTTLCGGETVDLNGLSEEASYAWNDFSTDSIRTISQSGFYKLTVTNKCGSHSDSIRIEILPFACEIYIPNAFSPNGDGLNSTFYPQGFFEFRNMEIYNRWGELLYYTEDLSKGWDGTANGADASSGVYFFVIRYELPDEAGRLTKKRVSGPVFLVR